MHFERNRDIPDDLSDLDKFIEEKESHYKLKKGTAARIIWRKGEHKKTDYAIVYLHGFRASHPEGNPVHKKVAEKLGCNLYLSRMNEHGLITDAPLLHLTEEKLIQSAHFAMEIGKRIGKKVILMGTSTGGSLALYLAAQPSLQQQISSLVLYSPLIRFHSLHEKLLSFSSFRSFLKLILGKDFRITSLQTSRAESKIWYEHYTLQGALTLGSFVQHHMTRECFERVKCPVFVGYYYKNRRQKDTVVSVPAIKKMVGLLGTRTESIQSFNFSEAKSHVITTPITSPTTKDVIYKSYNFLKKHVCQ